MELYEKNGNVLYILNVLKKYSDEEHILSAVDIQRKVKDIYNVNIDTRTIRRNINLLKYKFEYDISTRDENRKGYYILKNPDTDFESGEVRAIIDTFSYANYIVPSVSKNIINKCKNMQNIYENEKLKNYRIYAKNTKTDNMEVLKNIEDIVTAISNSNKIEFEYWKYGMKEKIEKLIVSKPKVSPYAIIYDNQQFYLIGIKEGNREFFHYRLDRIRNLQEINEQITIKKTKEQVREFAESSVEVFGGKKEEVEAICSNFLLDTIFDQFGKNITIIKNDKETFRLIVDTSTRGFKMWAMRNIDGVEVIKPESLRKEMKNVIEKASKKYKN